MPLVSSKRRQNILLASVILAALLLGFQNCASTTFTEDKSSHTKPASVEISNTETAACPQTKAPFEAMSVSQDEVGEGNEILSYRLGEINCGFTSFLVKIKAYGQFETFLAFRKNHTTAKNELLSQTEDGRPQFIYEAAFSVSSDGSSAIYMPQQIVDRAITYPEKIVRRDLFSKRIEVINQDANGKSIPLPKIPIYLHQKLSESKDGMIVLFLAQGKSSLYRKNLITGELTLINPELTSKDSSHRAVKSFSLDDSGLQALYHQTTSATESLLILNKENGDNVVFEGSGNTKIYDGIDTVVIQNSILSGNGKYAFFEGKYEGGRRIQDLNYYLIRKDITTGKSLSISLYQDKKSGDFKPIAGASLQSVTEDGNFVCLLAKPSKFKEPVKVDLENSANGTTESLSDPVMAYVKNVATAELKLVSVNQAGLPIEGTVTACTLDPVSRNVSYEVHPAMDSVRAAKSNAIDASARFEKQIKVYQNSY